MTDILVLDLTPGDGSYSW